MIDSGGSRDQVVIKKVLPKTTLHLFYIHYGGPLDPLLALLEIMPLL